MIALFKWLWCRNLHDERYWAETRNIAGTHHVKPGKHWCLQCKEWR